MKPVNPKELLELTLEHNFGIFALSKAKTNLFMIYYGLLPRNTMSKTCACFLIIVSFIQLFGLTITTLEATDYVVSSLKYFRIYPIIEYINSSFVYLGVIYAVTLCLLIYCLMVIIAIILPEGLSFHYASVIVPWCYWIGIVPIFELYLSFFSCNDSGNHIIMDDVKCWGIFHIIHLIGVILALMFFIIILFSVTFVSTYSHPYNKNPFKHYIWNFEIIYTFVRLIYIMFAYFYDESNSVIIYIQWGVYYITVIYLISLLTNIFPYYDCTISWYFAGCVMTFSFSIIWGSIIDLLKTIYNANETTYSMFLVMSIVIWFPLAKILRVRLVRKLMGTKKMKSAEELDMQAYIYIMGIIIKDDPMEINDNYLNGYVDFFKQSFKDENSPLKSNKVLEVERVFFDDSSEEKRRNINNGTQRHFAKYLLENEGNKDVFNSSLSLQLARICAYVIGNLHMACLKILDTEDMDPGIILQFSIFCFKQDIIKYLGQLALSRQKKGINSFMSVLVHQRLSMEFVELLKTSTNLRTKFFTELKDVANLNKLHKLGFKITQLNKQIKTMWDQLKDIYPYHLPILTVYKNYLYLVSGNTEETLNIQQILNKSLWEQGVTKEFSNKNLFSDDSTTIIMGGERHNTGKILMASKSVEKLFGYTPKTLVNVNVSILMPEIIRNQHNDILQHHFTTSVDLIKDNSFPSFGLHRNGYILPVKIAKQQVYSLKLGIIYVGNITLSDLEGNGNIILTDTNGCIAGISAKVGETLKITPNMITEQQFNIRDFCSELEDENISTLEGNFKIHFNNAQIVINETQRFKKRQSIKPNPAKGDDYIMNDPQSFTRCQISTYKYPQVNFSMKIFQLPSIRTITESKSINLNNLNNNAISSHIISSKEFEEIKIEANIVQNILNNRINMNISKEPIYQNNY